MTPLDVITAVRNRLGDAQKERWTDDTLLLYTSLAQKDICMFTHLYRLSTNIKLLPDVYIYDLPTDFMALSRIEYRDKFFPVETRPNIDKGEVIFPCIVKDNLLYNKIEFVIGESYKLLSNALNDAFGVVVDSGNDCELQDTFGVVTNVEGGSLSAPSAQPLDDLLVYYIAVPPNFTKDTDTIIVPDVWFQAFLHYVTGMALQDDNDANNIQRGELEAQKYTRLLEHIHAVSMKDFTTNAGTKLTTSYRRT
jgi:hypothetical protein